LYFSFGDAVAKRADATGTAKPVPARPEQPGAAVLRRASELHERGMTEGSPGCPFVVFTLCLNDDAAFEDAQAYCLLPSRTDSALAAERRTARADAATDDGVLLRFAGHQRTDGPR
jgi:hypothetical protein